MAMNISRNGAVALSAFLIALDVAVRLTPHPPNFTPIAATALFASFLLEGWILAAAVPMLALAISDLVIGGYDWRMMAVVYSALAVPLLLGRYLRGRLGPVRIAGSALASSVLFFLTTNFAVWCYGYWYTRDLKTLLQCYAAAVPFFRNTVAGDLFWSFILFTGYAVVRQGRPVILIPDIGSNPPGDR
jgi:hypothetical protein